MNEAIVIVSCYHLLFFTNEVSIEMQETYGWSLVAVIAALNVINLLVVYYHLAKYLQLVLVKFLKRFKNRFFPDENVETAPNQQP